jgi:hypothetical protein
MAIARLDFFMGFPVIACPSPNARSPSSAPSDSVFYLAHRSVFAPQLCRQYTTRPTGASPEAKAQESGRSRVKSQRMTGIYGVRHCVFAYT